MKALYDLHTRIASHDFYDWMACAKAAGATEIVFDISAPASQKWDAATALDRFRSIVEPGPALLGLPYSFGSEGQTVTGGYSKSLRELFAQRGDIPRLKSVLPPGKARYTVTLRNTRLPERNSNEPAWRAFAAEIGATVIEDHAVSPMPLHEKMALYAGAEMNFGVPNGPIHLIELSEYPVMVFAAQRSERAIAGYGIGPGEQYPWARPHQRLIWEDDDLPTLRRHFAAWRAA